MDIKILFIIVLYNQKLQDSATYKSLIERYPDYDVFVYDNSPVRQEIPKNLGNNIYYVHNSSNPGLSYAYNEGAKFAKLNNYNWIILLDQDTLFAPEIIEEYENVIRNHSQIKMIAPPMLVGNGMYMSPVRVKYHMARLTKTVPQGICSLYDYSPINSGLAIDVNSFWEVGGYNKNVKLDFADYEFVERFRKVYDKFYVLKTVCKQEFSNQVQTREQKLKRFEMFCESLRNCHKEGFSDNLSYFTAVVKRMLSLVFQTKSVKPFHTVFSKYLMK